MNPAITKKLAEIRAVLEAQDPDDQETEEEFVVLAVSKLKAVLADIENDLDAILKDHEGEQELVRVVRLYSDRMVRISKGQKP